jgi:uncharacterized membrane protein YeiH
MCAVAVSAMTGVLQSRKTPMDMFGVVLVALCAALGGGTLRDLLLGRPVFWVDDQTYLLVGVMVGMSTFLVSRLVRVPKSLFVVPDALGLALFTVLGAQVKMRKCC